MGYSERFCHLCGVGFNIGRIRKADEPIEAAWRGSGLVNDPVSSDSTSCQAEGCLNLKRTLDQHVFHDGSVKEEEEIEEHIAGEHCECEHGYSGWRISVEEMNGCTQVQCILYKADDWMPESTDEDFVVESAYCFLTGISTGPPDEFEVPEFRPIRHGVDSCMISNGEDPVMKEREWGTPMHPACLKIYERMSVERFGAVDIDNLRLLWWKEGDYDRRCEGLEGGSDCDMVCGQWYEAVEGTEYLAANPLNVPGLAALLKECENTGSRGESVFGSKTLHTSNEDPFFLLPPELKGMILLHLDRRDVAHLRHASRSFGELPQQYFQHLVRTEMPWVWEIKDMIPATVDWYKLWCSLSKADGGAGEDEAHRLWLRETRWSLSRKRHLVSGLSDNEKDQYPILCSEAPQKSLSKEQESAIAEIATQRRAEGRHLPRSTQIHGLRNRRRIYNDISTILDRIALLRTKGGHDE